MLECVSYGFTVLFLKCCYWSSNVDKQRSIHSSVVLYFAGVNLDLDKILTETIPSTYERAQIVASHPVAAAQFFNRLSSSILKCMVEKGVLGPIKAYFGTVENQGQNEQFRNGLLSYLEEIIE